MSSTNLIAGAVLVLAGAVLTITGLGALIGIPVGILGLAVMFPRFTKVVVVLATVAFVFLLFAA